MKTLIITPDQIIGSIGRLAILWRGKGARLRCDCGWEEKCMMSESGPKANAHMSTRHNGGQVIYKS